MVAILDFANMVGPWGARLGARQQSKQYDMGDLWVKLGAFRRIWTKISLTPLTRLNTLDRLLLLRLIYMQDCYVHRLISSCILQNLI